MRHLSGPTVAATLRRGNSVEQFLGTGQHDESTTLRWVAIHPASGEFVVVMHEVVDAVADMGTADVSEYPPVDPEEYTGEGRRLASSDTAEAALDLATQLAGCRPERWVNAGLVQDEVADTRG